MSKTYTLTVQKDPSTDDCFILLPDEITETLNWKIGDELNYQLEGKKVIVSNITSKNRKNNI